MKFSFQSYVVLFFISLLGFASCKKLDDEPAREATLISRLYVSFLEYDGSGESSIKNLMIVDPADTNDMSNIYQYLSPAKGGGPIIFDPRIKAIFQGSAGDNALQDTFIRMIPFQSDAYGIPGTAGNIGYRGFSNVRGLAYYIYSQSTGTGGTAANTEFILAATNNGTNSTLYAISSPSGKVGSRGGAKIVDKQINLGNIRPTSMALINGTSDNDKLLVIGFNQEGSEQKPGFAIYKGLMQELIERPRDTIVAANRFQPAMKLYVKGKSNLGAISYAPQRKLFAVTAYSGTASNPSAGEVLFFNDPDNLFKPDGTAERDITADRVVGGVQTGLVQPQSVAIDDRNEEGKFFYVSDRNTRKISRFPLNAEGNVSPDIAPTFGNLTPNYIFLDARSANNF